MKLYKTIAISLATLGMSLVTLVGNGSAAQPACYQYNQNGFQTSQTPVFNDICGVPGVGNESDFVRLRQSTNGNDEDFQNNPPFTVGNVSSACTDGTKYDVWNYVHNNAETQFNNNGTGTAVAHNVTSLMQADLNKTGNSFNFGDTISASNAASTVNDSIVLSCSGNTQVKLTLVPGSVHLISEAISNGAWQNLSDSTINNSLKLGSPTMGSGDMWGCWNYRIVVVYQVTITKVQTPQVTATCNYINVLANSDRTVSINQFNITNINATFANAVIDWGDNSNTTTVNDSNAVVGQTHQYATAGQYVISATVTFTVPGQNNIVSGGPNTKCAEQVTFTSNTPPTIAPPTTVTPPTTLVNTGSGSVVAIFSAVTALGAISYRWLLGRRLSRQ